MKAKKLSSIWSRSWTWLWSPLSNRSGSFLGRTSSQTSAKMRVNRKRNARTRWTFWNYWARRCLTSVKIHFFKVRQPSWRRLLPMTSSPSTSFVNMSSCRLLKHLKQFSLVSFGNVSRLSKPTYLGFLLVTFSKPIWSRTSSEIWSNRAALE